MSNRCEIFTVLPIDLKKERSRFLDLRRDSHTSVVETEKHPSFLVINFFSQKPDLLLLRISDFIQENFLPWGEHHDWRNANSKSFQLLERHFENLGYDY
jgi:hypothetical protein